MIIGPATFEHEEEEKGVECKVINGLHALHKA